MIPRMSGPSPREGAGAGATRLSLGPHGASTPRSGLAFQRSVQGTCLRLSLGPHVANVDLYIFL